MALRADELPLKEAVEASVAWLFGSGIRAADASSPFCGAYFDSYESRTKERPWVYCEITGYAAQYWLRAARLKGRKEFSSLAQDAGSFLLKAQEKEGVFRGAFPFGFKNPGGEKAGRYFSFDNGVILAALVDLYRYCGESKYLEAAVLAGEWLLSMQDKDGSFRAFSADADAPGLPAIERWFSGPGSLHGKNSIGLIKLYYATGEARYMESATKVLDWVLGLQNRDGGIRAYPEDDYVFTHAHCYALEGFIHAYLATGDEKYREAAKKGGDYLLKVQHADGSVDKCTGADVGKFIGQTGLRLKPFRRFLMPRDLGPLAQALRVWLFLESVTGEGAYREACNRALGFILRMQSLERGDASSYGGFLSSAESVFGLYRLSRRILSWECMFASHALMLMERGVGAGEFIHEVF